MKAQFGKMLVRFSKFMFVLWVFWVLGTLLGKW